MALMASTMRDMLNNVWHYMAKLGKVGSRLQKLDESGDLIGDVTGDVTGDLTGSVDATGEGEGLAGPLTTDSVNGLAPAGNVAGAAAEVAADELAIPLTAPVVLKTTGADAEALTLADGSPGQDLTIILATAGGGVGTLTPTTKTGFASLAFEQALDQATLRFMDETIGWVLIGHNGVAVA